MLVEEIVGVLAQKESNRISLQETFVVSLSTDMAVVVA
jgi:hypothetical protein